jgi:hypothetical protein
MRLKMPSGPRVLRVELDRRRGLLQAVPRSPIKLSRFRAPPHPNVSALQGDNKHGAHWRVGYFVYKSDPAPGAETVVLKVRGMAAACVNGRHADAVSL